MSSFADGSVTLSVDMNVSDADKTLAKQKKKIEKIEQDISGYQKKRDEARKKAPYWMVK